MISIDMYLDYPKFIASNQIEESIRTCIQKATLNIHVHAKLFSRARKVTMCGFSIHILQGIDCESNDVSYDIRSFSKRVMLCAWNFFIMI